MSTVKFLVFSDYHFDPEAYPISADHMSALVEKAKANNADLILHCGDFMHDCVTYRKEFDTVFKNKYSIPAYGCYGNHELQGVDSLEKLNEVYGIDNSYFYFDFGGFRFIITDTNNYRDDDGNTVHYQGRSYGGACKGGKDTNALGDEQLKWLKETIDGSEYPVIVLSHAAFEKDAGGSEDAKAVREIFAEANAKRPHSVIMSIYGHYHRNSINVKDGVVYFDVNATFNGEWVPRQHDLFPPEFCEGHYMAKNCAIFKDPLSAIVTVSSDGKIKVEGMETGYMYDVSPEMFGGPFESGYGICEPRISSAEITL